MGSALRYEGIELILQRISKYKSFEFAQNSRLRTFTKATYFIALSATRNVNSFEVYSPNLEYAETWLCSSKSLTPQVQAAITAVPGIFRFRVYTHDPPLHTELGATDRCCVSFGIAESEVRTVTDTLASIYACLSQEIACSTQQDLQRVIPLFWNMRLGDAPTFYCFRTATFLDVRSCTQEERWQLQSILIDMNIPYYIQKRLLSVIYAEGAELENFRLRTFQEQIKIPFGKEEGSLQCSFTAGISENNWTVDISTTGSDTHEAFQIEDDGSLMMKDGTVDVDFSEELQKVLGAIQIRPAIVHVQDKGQQKVVAFYASPASFPRIPGTFVDHKAYKRIVHYKQPDVHTTERTSNIYVKETKTDHHVGAHYTTVDPKQFVFFKIETRACDVQSWETNVKDCKAETDTAVQSGRTHLKKELRSPNSKPFGELFFKREHDAGHAAQSAGS